LQGRANNFKKLINEKSIVNNINNNAKHKKKFNSSSYYNFWDGPWSNMQLNLHHLEIKILVDDIIFPLSKLQTSLHSL
jgi:arabinogalactan endo-1,4-beta-galactosidase